MEDQTKAFHAATLPGATQNVQRDGNCHAERPRAGETPTFAGAEKTLVVLAAGAKFWPSSSPPDVLASSSLSKSTTGADSRSEPKPLTSSSSISATKNSEETEPSVVS